MRLLVLSDSHNYIYNLEQILMRERSADMIIHCGDGADDMYSMTEYTSGKPLYLVKGNCDSMVHNFAERCEINADGKRVIVCHGDKYGVRFGYEKISLLARSTEADLCLFGHTHSPFCEYADGSYLFNPGAVKNGQYGIIDITQVGITPLNKSL